MMSSEKTILSREAIANRMFKNAAKYWGLTDTNIDNFDPLVRMLIEACAVEMHRISNQIETVQERMIDKLAGMLTPQVYVLPKPAHGVLHARSIDAESYSSNKMQFFYQKKIASKSNGPLDSNVDIYFSPTGAYKLFDGDVVYIATGNNIYSINKENAQKELFIQSATALPYRTAWIGIETQPEVRNLNDTTLFLDLKNVPEKDKITSLLSYVQCSVNGTPLNMKKGIESYSRKHTEEHFNTSLNELYVNARMEMHCEELYRQQFISFNNNKILNDINQPNIKQRYPVEFEKCLGAKELSLLNKEVLWIKLYFRPEFTQDILDDLTIATNCFPIINRRLNETNYKLQSYFNIIPLFSNEQFLSINKVEGLLLPIDDKEYKQYPYDTFDKSIKGTYSVRHGDLERFDSRNAVEYMNYLVDLLRDESRAFAAMGQDFIASIIRNMNQNIAQIEQKLKQTTTTFNNTPAYLLINPVVEGDTIFAQYWTCNGIVGNGLRSGSKFELYDGISLQREGITLMTTTWGGTNKLRNSETLPAYKNILLSRDRIVTLEDVRKFCEYYLSNKSSVSQVQIEPGVAVSTKPKQGLIPTIDIMIVPSAADQLIPEEWEGIKHELLVSLEEQSAVNLNYRIFVNQNN